MPVEFKDFLTLDECQVIDNTSCRANFTMKFTLTYATGGISALNPVNIVTNVSMHVTSSVTRPGIASNPNQKLNHESITTNVDGAKVCIK